MDNLRKAMKPCQIKNLTAKTFGRLSVIKFAGIDKNKKANWICKCSCGTLVTVIGSRIISGRTKSCGCLTKEISIIIGSNNKTHGQSKSSEYKSWVAMRHRCYNKDHSEYKNYGGRGIKVCKRWKNSFQNFIDDMGPKPDGYSIERIDNNKGYNKNNCKWATRTEQGRNKRNNIWISFKRKCFTQTEFAKTLGVTSSTIKRRLDMGWTPEDIYEFYINKSISKGGRQKKS